MACLSGRAAQIIGLIITPLRAEKLQVSAYGAVPCVSVIQTTPSKKGIKGGVLHHCNAASHLQHLLTLDRWTDKISLFCHETVQAQRTQ